MSSEGDDMTVDFTMAHLKECRRTGVPPLMF